jgi:hypothetical protein
MDLEQLFAEVNQKDSVTKLSMMGRTIMSVLPPDFRRKFLKYEHEIHTKHAIELEKAYQLGYEDGCQTKTILPSMPNNLPNRCFR